MHCPFSPSLNTFWQICGATFEAGKKYIILIMWRCTVILCYKCYLGLQFAIVLYLPYILEYWSPSHINSSRILSQFLRIMIDSRIRQISIDTYHKWKFCTFNWPWLEMRVDCFHTLRATLTGWQLRVIINYHLSWFGVLEVGRNYSDT